MQSMVPSASPAMRASRSAAERMGGLIFRFWSKVGEPFVGEVEMQRRGLRGHRQPVPFRPGHEADAVGRGQVLEVDQRHAAPVRRRRRATRCRASGRQTLFLRRGIPDQLQVPRQRPGLAPRRDAAQAQTGAPLAFVHHPVQGQALVLQMEQDGPPGPPSVPQSVQQEVGV